MPSTCSQRFRTPSHRYLFSMFPSLWTHLSSSSAISPISGNSISLNPHLTRCIGPSPPPSTPPRGTLRLFLSSSEHAGISLQRLCKLEPEYGELDIYETRGSNTSHIHPVISSCERPSRTQSWIFTIVSFKHSIRASEHSLTHYLGSPTDSTHTLKNLSELRKFVFSSPFLRLEEISLINYHFHEHPAGFGGAISVDPRHRAEWSGRSFARVGIQTHPRTGISPHPQFC